MENAQQRVMNTLPLTTIGRLSLGFLLGAPIAAKGQSVHAVLPSAPPAVDEMRLLRAIAAVETGTTNLARPCRKIGRAGERSAWQIKASVWRQYTRIPFVHASTDATLAHLIALLHLQQLRERAKRDRLPATVWNLAYLWNAGRRAHSYSENVKNLYEDFSRP